MKKKNLHFQSRQMDAELIEQQNKLKKHIAHYEKLVNRYNNFFTKQPENQNGNA